MRKYGVAKAISWVLVAFGAVFSVVAIIAGISSLLHLSLLSFLQLGQALGLGAAGVLMILFGFAFHALFDMTEKYLGRGGG